MAASALSVLPQMFYEPKAAFESLKEKPNAWLILALMLVSTLAMFFWFYSVADFAFLVEHALSAQPDMKPDQREVMEKLFTKNTMMYMTLGLVAIGTPIILAVYALYLLIASKIMGSAIGYGKWFYFSIWISVPSLIGLPLMAMQIMTGNGTVPFEDLNMLSLNYLVFHFPVSHPWARMLGGVSLTTFWTMFLSFVGLRVWTGRSATACAIASVLPYAVIYGIWIAKLVFFK